MSKKIVKGALYMAKMGFHVFPLLKRCQKGENSRGTPLGWNHNKPDNPKSIPSTTNLDEIKSWLKKYDDLIGYGVNPRNRRAVILDVDVKDDKVGADSLRQLVKDYKLNLKTFCVRTKSGGLHLYYSYDGIPEGFYVKGTLIEGYPDIDLRCDNSFVNGPYEEGPYTIINDTITEPLPEALIEKLPLQSLTNKFKMSENPLTGEALDYSDKVLKGIIPDVIYKGERDNTLIRLIGSWARKYPIETTIILTKEAISRCEGSDLSIDQYIPKIESTYEKENFKPLKPDMLEWMEDHLVLIPDKKSVYDMSQPAHKAIMLKDAASDKFKNWIYYIEDEKSGKKKKIYSFTAWMESPNRKTFSSYGYFPKDVREYYCDIQDCQVVNTYSAPFRDKKQNEFDFGKYQDYVEEFKSFCEFLFGEEADYMLDWVAHQVQKPHKKLTVAPVLISESRGVGKNLFFDIVKNIVGKWNTTEADVSEAIDRFCEFAIRHHVVLINEANVDVRDKKGLNSRREMMERLKTKISENMQTVEPKFVGRFNVQSYINYLVAGNTMDGLPIETGDRRFHVIKIESKRQPREFYDKLWDIGKSSIDDPRVLDRAYALRYYFMNRKITQLFKGDVAKMTIAKQEMIDAGKSAEQLFIDEAIRDRYSIFRSNIITKELFYWYVTHKLPQGHKLSSGAINDLFRNNFKPVLREKGSGRARQLRVKLPEHYVSGQILPEESKNCALYTVRNHGAFNFSTDTKWFKHEYMKAHEATKYGFEESDVENDSDNIKKLKKS